MSGRRWNNHSRAERRRRSAQRAQERRRGIMFGELITRMHWHITPVLEALGRFSAQVAEAARRRMLPDQVDALRRTVEEIRADKWLQELGE